MPPAAVRAAVLLRVTLGLLLTIHGVYRVVAGGVVPFGGFLDSRHIPLGLAVAWLITVVEVVGGPLLIFGLFVRPLCAWFAVVLLAGIALVHAAEGWFVVGGGRNGMEFSVLLILGLVVTAMFDAARRDAFLPS